MVRFNCDGCGKEMDRKGLRYVVNIDVRAAYDELEVGMLELVRDHRSELLELFARLEKASQKNLEEGVYKGLELDLCPSCQRVFIRDPLRFQPSDETGPVDVDAFLRSLGYGGKPSERDE